MNILPRYGLLQYRNTVRIYLKDISESLTLFKQETKDKKSTLFILHLRNELEELDSAINFLKNSGALIYTDWVDENITEDKSRVTHKHILKKLKKNKKFVFLATEQAIQSVWCQWVLECASTQKKPDQIAILPIREDFSDYSNIKLLQKYSYIQQSDADPDQYDVFHPSGTTTALNIWLST